MILCYNFVNSDLIFLYATIGCDILTERPKTVCPLMTLANTVLTMWFAFPFLMRQIYLCNYLIRTDSDAVLCSSFLCTFILFPMKNCFRMSLLSLILRAQSHRLTLILIGLCDIMLRFLHRIQYTIVIDIRHRPHQCWKSASVIKSVEMILIYSKKSTC